MTNRTTVDENILQIDENALNRECVHLPYQYRQATTIAADTALDLDETKAELELHTAELRLQIRNTPGKFNLEKVTEGAIADVIAGNPKGIALEKKIRELKHDLELHRSLVAALEIKKRSLSNLVELHAAGYFAEVRPSEKGREFLKNQTASSISRPIPRDKKDREKERD